MGRKKRGSSLSTSPCAHLRAAYHSCFNRWYSEKFVKGHWDKQECGLEWKKYRDCLAQNLEDKHLSRFLEAGGVGDFTDEADSATFGGGPQATQARKGRRKAEGGLMRLRRAGRRGDGDDAPAAAVWKEEDGTGYSRVRVSIEEEEKQGPVFFIQNGA